MKFALFAVAAAALAQTASAHYIWTTLVAGSTTTTTSVRQPVNNSPVSVVGSDIKCNTSPGAATTVTSVAAGTQITWKLDNTLYHLGPAAIYLGKAPSNVTTWDGSGTVWFKIAEWGMTWPNGQGQAVSFADYNLSQLSATIPKATPSGDYLLRIEQIGLHVAGAPQFYISCAQITITGGGSGNPTKYSLPPYSASDPGLTVNIYYPIPTSYTVPGPRPWTG